MRREYVVLAIVLLLNALIALLYLILGRIFRHKEPLLRGSRGINFCIMLLCPVVGCAFISLSYLLTKCLFRTEVDLEDVIFSKDRVKTYNRAKEEVEGNMVPMEEALAVSDTSSLRAYMLNVIRREASSSLASIRLALNSQDTETAHYAASILQQSLNDFRSEVQSIQKAMEEDPDDFTEYGVILIDYMKDILQQNVLDDLEQTNYVVLMSDVAKRLYETDSNCLRATHVEQIALCFIDLEDYENALYWTKRSKELFPRRLESYTLPLKLYFKKGDKDRFFIALEELKQSDVVINRETLELIRALSKD